MAIPNPKEEARLKKILTENQRRISPMGIAQRQAQMEAAQKAINAKRDREARGK